ncbi:radical SAM protein [bacterium]|nr:radical SAM protein [bacterium]
MGGRLARTEKKIGPASTRYANILTSRGCQAHCIFCSSPMMWGHFRARSPENVLDELEHLVLEYGVEEIHFQDNNITADIARADRLFRGMIERNFRLHWTTPNGIALYKMTPALIETMRASGCYSVWIALESGSQTMLNRIKKPLNLGIIKPLVTELKRHDIRVSGFFLIGLPGETRADIMQTIEYARGLELDYATFSIVQPLPGTELYDMCFGDEGPVDFSRIKFARGDYSLSHISRDELEVLRRYAWEQVNDN